MKTVHSLCAFLLLCIAQAALAAPVNLVCQIDDNHGELITFNITADETTGFVTMQDGRAQHASFAETEVAFDNWRINRVDLSVTRLNYWIGGVIPTHGQCKLAPRPVERAF